ncbi:hypothetical protein MPTK1_5g19370 [Marchantia polymorpha subsp. ruderalis]|uniref:Dipeptidylpeptidase IV N-terminal domain-containing protein n=2 Tax=Marchantia polymorpha TaxID=3197 RepID=A0AAF6BK16_MARPO|nr:hypothetical protein MARPO_0073s0007 [Marchantia polymorpha]BBN12350.1 hypothetical protein Mp_5g19370 [Marchantia polymorpha subsp. ruderalis]|eukprot:PTQ35127.1 hypothetical protein MARPO_0073s0007 [Marchantia polymorpha]
MAASFESFSLYWKPDVMTTRLLCTLLRSVLIWTLLAIGNAGDRLVDVGGTIAFASVGRPYYAFDVFAVSLPQSWSSSDSLPLSPNLLKETRLTDGVSINYNGHFVEGSERRALEDFLSPQARHDEDSNKDGSGIEALLFVSDRAGNPRIYINDTGRPLIRTSEMVENGARRSLAKIGQGTDKHVGPVQMSFHDSEHSFMNDKPSICGNRLVFVSTAEPSGTYGTGWAAVFSTSLKTGKTVRLTPAGHADYSPAISPSGKWIAAASFSGKHIQVNVLKSDLYVYRSSDGSKRRLVVESGGWPTWLDEQTIFFHRVADDGWWSIFRVDLPVNFLETGEGEVQEPERITPPGVHVITPAAYRTGNWLAVATRRPEFLKHVRHVEIFDLKSGKFIELTALLYPNVSHYSPFLSSSGKVGYHRCRGTVQGKQSIPLIEVLPSPLPNLALIRVDGTFPSISPDGTHLAFSRDTGDSGLVIPTKEKGIYVISLDGEVSQRLVYTGRAFGTVWDPLRRGVLFVTAGKCFEVVSEEIHIISVANVCNRSQELSVKQLTKYGTGNNAMPYPSPDGKLLVFKSGRSGWKNLYIMDAFEGEEKMLRRLTNGNWSDNHPHWSPSGEWIIFMSNREDPHGTAYNIFQIRPDGTGLHKVLDSGLGQDAHPCFMGNDKFIAMSSDVAGFSAEPISMPLQFNPQGEIFVAEVNDPSSMLRMTHNSVEDGSARWSPHQFSKTELQKLSTSGLGKPLKCNNPDYYADVWPTVANAHAPCAHAPQNSHHRRHYEL